MDSFYRDRSKGVIAGVCAGLAEYFHVHPALVRLIFILIALAGGPAVLVYIVLWIVLPKKTAIGSPHRTIMHDNVREIATEARNLSQELQDMFGGECPIMTSTGKRVIWLGAIFIVIGLALLIDNLHLLSWFRLDMLWAFALILAGVVLLHRALRRS